MIDVLPVEAFEDNYIWLLKPEESNDVVIVDPGDETPVLTALKARKLNPVAILCTHHHWDHVGGVPKLCRLFDIPVYGPANENIADLTHALDHGDTVELEQLGLRFEVIDVPGHTRGHIAYYGHGLLFCGDTLFSGGCGRLFEGTAEQMYQSLQKMAKLPTETQVYCAHEYTLANLRFGQTVEPDNRFIHGYIEEITSRRRQHQPSLPSTIEQELKINPFLRSGVAAVREAACRHSGKSLNSEVEVFATVRRWKDTF